MDPWADFKQAPASGPQSDQWSSFRQAPPLKPDPWSPQMQGPPQPDYDTQAYTAKYGVPDQSKGQHLTDEFKLPNHMTFSTDSSYSSPEHQGGKWSESQGKWSFTPSDFNLKQHSPKEMQAYFDSPAEKGKSTLNLPKSDSWSAFRKSPQSSANADPWAAFKPSEPEQSSTLGAGARAAAESALPTAGGIAGGMTGAGIGGALGGLPGALVGGVVGGIGGGALASAAQQKAISMLPQGAQDWLAKQLQADQSEHPIATKIGRYLPLAAAFSPGAELALGSRALGGAVMGGMEAGQELVHGGGLHPGQIAESAAAGAIFNKPTRIGRALGAPGEMLGAAMGKGPKAAGVGKPAHEDAPSPLKLVPLEELTFKQGESGGKFTPMDAKEAAQVFSPKSLSGAASPVHPNAIIKAGKGIWGASTEGRNVLRQQTGKFAREAAKQDVVIEKFRRASNQMTHDQTLDWVRYMQGRSKGATLTDPGFKAMADESRRIITDNRFEIEKTDSLAQMEFEEDHFRQLWNDPRKAAQVFTDFVAGKEGSGGFTKKKKYPTWDDGIAAGLTPKSWNVMDILANDTANQNKFISMARSRDVMTDQGYLKWAMSGKEVPDGWVPLKGWGARKGMGWQSYSPPGMARNYNNFVGKGWADVSPVAGSIARGLRATTAGATSLELGLSGYHALAITKEAFHTSIADAVYEAAHGRILSAGKELAKAPVAAPYYLLKGMRASREYLGLNQGSATLTKAVDALSEVHAHMTRIDPAFLSGTGGSLWKTFKRGAFQKEFENSVRLINEAPGILGKLGTTAKEVGGALGDVLNTISEPLFQHIIPNIKRGMMTEGLSKWIDANPAASWDQILDKATELSDVADERFGEMMQDDLFWQPIVKQSAQIAMRSASWAYGSWTQYLGGIKQFASIPKEGLSRRSAYVIAGLIAEPLVGAAVMYAMTGKRPEDVRDYFFPKTGGTVPEHPYGKPGVTYTVPERLQLPGNYKELIDAWGIGIKASHGDLSGFREYASGKLNDFWQSVGDLTTNTQWPNDPLYNSALPESAAQQYFKWAWNRFGPISIKSAQQDIPKGSHIGPALRFLGPRVPGRQWIDPEGVEYARQQMNKQKAAITQRREKRRHEDAAPVETLKDWTQRP